MSRQSARTGCARLVDRFTDGDEAREAASEAQSPAARPSPQRVGVAAAVGCHVPTPDPFAVQTGAPSLEETRVSPQGAADRGSGYARSVHKSDERNGDAMASAPIATKFSDAQVAELLALTKGADSVELKLTVPLSDRSRAGAALGVDPLEGQIRQVYFFDTPDLALNRSGVVVRARRVQRKGCDSVVKLRPVVPEELSPELRLSPNFGVEVDALPGGFVCSGSMKHVLGMTDVRDAVMGKQSLRKLFSNEQRSLFAEHAPDGLKLNDLSILGPILVFKLRLTPEGYERRLVAELWMYPDNSMILELSTKCAPSEAFQKAAELKAFLTKRDIDLSGDQETKTKKALEYFSEHLGVEGG